MHWGLKGAPVGIIYAVTVASGPLVGFSDWTALTKCAFTCDQAKKLLMITRSQYTDNTMSSWKEVNDKRSERNTEVFGQSEL